MRDLKEHIPLEHSTFSPEEMKERSQAFFKLVNSRRTVRDFDSRPIDPEVLDNIILSASSAPSGANKQPWTFCVVTNPETKSKIRKAAEQEEYENYYGRMTDEWLNDLKEIGTDHIKEFLEEAPALIVVFKQLFEEIEEEKKKNYYVAESVGLAAGILLAAIHNAGLVAVTHTPSPMAFLARVLERPSNERAFLLIPVGHPKAGAVVPDIKRKNLEDIRVNYR